MVAATAFSIPTSSASGSRRTARAAALLSLLLHLLAALAWAWPRLPSLPDDEPPAVTVDIVPPLASKGENETEAEPAATPASEPEAKQIPRLDPGSVADKPVASGVPVKKAPVTRNERDMVLSQVIRHWKPPRELMAYDAAEFKVRVTVLADGTLAAPFSVRAPYDPAAAIEGFDGLHPQDPRRRATEAFYRALRQAQPFKLPPQLAAKAPFPVMLDFRVKDVR